jgi:ribosomal protein S18 acetylase RimI-like enzyme
LITEAIRAARQRNVTYAVLITSKDDQRAPRLYAAAGLPRTEDRAVRSRLPTNEIRSPGRVTHFSAYGRTASRDGRVADGSACTPGRPWRA